MDWAEEFVRGMIVRGIKTKDSFRLILTNIPLRLTVGATKRAHGSIMAQKAEIAQVMMTTFFKTRNPRKHWPKRAPGALLSSMYS